jgi:hypothetical protein
VGIAIGSTEVPGRKGLCETRDIIMMKMIVMMMMMMMVYTTRISCVIAVNLRIRLGTPYPFVPVCISFRYLFTVAECYILVFGTSEYFVDSAAEFFPFS